MRTTAFLLAALLPALLLLPTPADAQALTQMPTIEELRGQSTAARQTLVARALRLTPAEEADFWPVYDEVQAGLAAIAARRSAARAAVAGEDADDAVEALVEADVAQAELFERAWSRLRGKLPPDKLARYLDLERRAAAAALP